MSLRSRRPRVVYLGAVVASLVGAPAWAGRASACKAPPLSVPRETQRAVDAAIDARVTGAGAGGASSGVEARTDYDTTTLSQDDAARLWVEYTLCEKLARHLISQELHDELLRELVVGAVPRPTADAPTAGPVNAPTPAGPADEELRAALPGTWQVSSTFRWSTCPAPNDDGGVTAYSWLVSRAADDQIRIDVLGQTAYPQLLGAVSGGQLVVGGDQISAGQIARYPLGRFDDGSAVGWSPRSLINVRLVDGGLVGTRDVLMLTPASSAPDASGWRYQLCQVHFDVVGRR